MKAMVVYDSKWGNTQKIAEAIASGIGGGTKALRVGDLESTVIADKELLVLGCPVIIGKPSKPMQEYLKSVAKSLKGGPKIAVFDTRMTSEAAKKYGYAADQMISDFKKQGCNLVSEPKGFIVVGRNGPLAEGEEKRATKWGKELAKS